MYNLYIIKIKNNHKLYYCEKNPTNNNNKVKRIRK